MPKFAVLIVTAAALAAGCSSTNQRAAAGGTAAQEKEVGVRWDDARESKHQTQFDLRVGDRVQLMSDGRVAPL